MFRFFVNEKNNNLFPLNDDVLRHIKVARVQNEEFICIYKEIFYICKLVGTNAEIIRTFDEDHEFAGEVILASSFIDTKRFEWLIQKAAELGCTKLIPMISHNISKKIPFDIDKKLSRWNQIALNASEQSFRNKTLIVEQPMDFSDVIKLNLPNKYIAHEKTNDQIKKSFEQDSIFLVGPEGGFTEDEINRASKKNFQVISLGKRILRAETASLFILSRIN